MITCKNVYKTFHQNAQSTVILNNINMILEANQCIGIIGKSGAGKSTLLRCFNLLEQPSSGEVWVNGQNLCQLNTKQLRRARSKIGVVFQHFNLLNCKTVFDNVALPLNLIPQHTSDLNESVFKLLTLVGLEKKALHYPSQLSGGEKQRVAIARGLINNPHILLCDEITSALDPETSQSIIALLKNIQRQCHITVVLVTHDVSLVQNHVDRVILMDRGSIIENQATHEFFTQPKTLAAQNIIRRHFQSRVPQSLQQQLSQTRSNQAVVQVQFHGQQVTDPIINTLIKKHQLNINIFQANIETIHNEALGTMTLSATGSQESLHSALVYLHTQSCDTQILGYLPS